MTRCTRCIMPDTKPDLTFDEEGVCSACRAYERRASVDWTARREELRAILSRYANPSFFDCIVPVSGGKDSTFQALTIRELGFNPLLVTATTDEFSDIGKRNLDNLIGLGFDHVQVTVNPKVRRQINRIALETVGDISWPEHVTIFTVPVRLSVQLGIPLIVWGENPQHEYGGPASAQETPHLTRAWLDEFGGLLGMSVDDLRGRFTDADLALYTYPTDEELARAGTTGLFLGHYVPWDGRVNALIAQAHGFETWPHPVEGSITDYENLDNVQTGIHDDIGRLKHGYSRAEAQVSLAIRRGMMTRERGLEVAAASTRDYPHTTLGVPIADTLARIGMTVADYDAVRERFAR